MILYATQHNQYAQITQEPLRTAYKPFSKPCLYMGSMTCLKTIVARSITVLSSTLVVCVVMFYLCLYCATMLAFNLTKGGMLESETCVICGEGEAKIAHELQTVVLYGVEVEVPLYYRMCSHCTSDYAGKAEFELNKNAMLEARSGISNQFNERKDMQPNKIIITEDTSDTQSVSPNDFIKQLAYAMRFADAGLSEKQVVTMSMYLKARLS